GLRRRLTTAETTLATSASSNPDRRSRTAAAVPSRRLVVATILRDPGLNIARVACLLSHPAYPKDQRDDANGRPSDQKAHPDIESSGDRTHLRRTCRAAVSLRQSLLRLSASTVSVQHARPTNGSVSSTCGEAAEMATLSTAT